MYLFFTILTFLFIAAKLPPPVTGLIVLATVLVTRVGQRTVFALTGAPSPAKEVLESVGLGLFVMALLWTNVLSFNHHFDGTMKIELGWSFFVAYAAGFAIAMRIAFLQALVVAAVTTALSVALIVILWPVVASALA